MKERKEGSKKGKHTEKLEVMLIFKQLVPAGTTVYKV